MKQFVINGLFLTKKITGIERYAREIVNELDKLVNKGEFVIAVPPANISLPGYKNIEIVKVGKERKEGKLSEFLWEQFDFLFYLRKHKRIPINLCNRFPLLYARGFAVIHDISYKVNRKLMATSIKSRLASFYYRLFYFVAFHSDMRIITVSNFSKNEIIRSYKIKEDRIKVINNSWQHINRISTNDNLLKKEELQNIDYYFAMSSILPNKNFKWVLYAAKNNPDKTFVIAGGGRLKDLASELGLSDLKNLHYLGYVSDEEAKTLMKYCKAYIFPTFYEGFGLTPLEAIASGAKDVIVSDTPCMHEVYSEYVQYLNPFDYSEKALSNVSESIGNVEDVLNKYSWSDSASKLLSIMLADKK